MNRERFIRDRRADWGRFEQLLGTLQSLPERQWRAVQVAELARLYRSICYDLSLVQSREWGSRLEDYLNDLVASGHNCLYRTPPTSLAAALEFIAIGFPRLLRQRWRAFALATTLFLVPFLVGTAVGVMRPDLARCWWLVRRSCSRPLTATVVNCTRRRTSVTRANAVSCLVFT